jgi:cytochrome c-type biogenesis protein
MNRVFVPSRGFWQLLAASLVLFAPLAFAQGSSTASVSLNIFTAFFGGLISFLSPCVLPLVPSYLAVLGGGAGKSPVGGALLFILGFSITFIALGAGASSLGNLLQANQDVLARIGGVLILVFGIVFLIKDRVPFLSREYRSDLGGASRYGLVALGAAFAAGWTPCIGPILGVILSLAANSADVGVGVGYLAVYSLGLGIPFLLSAVAWRQVSSTFKSIGRWIPTVEKASGVLLIVTGLLLLTGEFTRLNAILQPLTPDWLRKFL